MSEKYLEIIMNKKIYIIGLILTGGFLSCSHKKTMHQCSTLSQTRGLIVGTGVSKHAAFENAMSKKFGDISVKTKLLWNKLDKDYESKIPRVKSFEEYFNRLNQLNSSCEVKTACKTATGVRITAKCGKRKTFSQAVSKFLHSLKHKLPPFAKVVVTSNFIGEKPSSGMGFVKELIENEVYKIHGEEEFNLIKYRYADQMLWDLLPFSMMTTKYSHTLLKDAHFLIHISLNGRKLYLSFYNIRKSYPSHIETKAFALNSSMVKLIQKDFKTEPCEDGNCLYSKGVKSFLDSKNKIAKGYLKKSCDKGYTKGCVFLANMKQNNEFNEKILLKEISVLQKECTALGINYTNLAIVKIAGLVVENSKTPIKANSGLGLFKNAVDSFIKSCAGNEPYACINLVKLNFSMAGYSMSQPKAIKLYKKACKYGSATGCAESACFSCFIKASKDKGLKPYVGKHFETYTKILKNACRDGRAGGCTVQSLFPGTKEIFRLEAIKKACVWGTQELCFLAGNTYAMGTSNTKIQKALAMEYSHLGCKEGDEKSCNLYGEALLKTKNTIKGIKFLNKRCSKGSPHDCYLLGKYYMERLSVEKNYEKIAEIYKKGCLKPAKDKINDVNVFKSCGALSYLYFKGEGVVKSMKEAKRFAVKACDKNSGNGCYVLGLMEWEKKISSEKNSKPKKIEKRSKSKKVRKRSKSKKKKTKNLKPEKKSEPDHVKTALKFFNKGCDNIDKLSCAWLKNYYGKLKNLNRETHYTMKGCEAGDISECHKGGVRIYRGIGMKRDGNVIFGIFNWSCNHGESDSCSILANYFLGAPKTKENLKMAFEYIYKSCEWGFVPACETIASKEKSAKNVISLHKKLCLKNDLNSCNTLGWLLIKSKKIKPNKKLGLWALKKSCEGGNYASCTGYGVLYYYGGVVKQNYKTTFKYYKKACDGMFAPGCSDLAWLYEKGKGVKKDIVKALLLYGSSCKAGHLTACQNLGTHYQIQAMITRSERPLVKAEKYLKKCCNNGMTASCHALGLLYEDKHNKKFNNPKMAKKYFEKACKGGFSFSCQKLKTLKK
jgi:uncharacterized protein